MKESRFKLRFQDILLFFAVVIVGAVGYFVALPQAAAIKVKSQTLATNQTEITKLKARITSLNQAAALLPQYKQDIDRLSIAFPSTDQQIEALIQTQSIVERSGLTLININPASGKDGKLPIAIRTLGSYGAYKSLVNEINSNLRPAFIRTMSLSAGGADQGNLIAANILIEYAYVAAPVVPKTSTPAVVPGEEDSTTAGKKVTP